MAGDKGQFKFTVASQLFRELGERLVGRPAIALGELVKNAYDADAYHVEVTLEPRHPKLNPDGRIVVRDSGHGMTKDEFQAYWMRVGDDRKARERYSPYLGRLFSGSKGVGRIAAQFLSHELRIETISVKTPNQKFVGWLDWRKAIETGDLQEVGVQYEQHPSGADDFPGTAVVLENLKQDWAKNEIIKLAGELWTLEPPYRKRDSVKDVDWAKIPPLPPPLAHRPTRNPESDGGFRRPDDFSILFHSPYSEAVSDFESTQRQIMNLWAARITGGIRKGNPEVAIEFRGDPPSTFNFPQLRRKDQGRIEDAKFEIFIYDVKGRQPGGVSAEDVRSYLEVNGGVQIFDHRFRLPYYGELQNDWLRITYDHALRLSKSPLLPEKLQIPEGMYYMPNYRQVFGFVEIQTGDEPNLKISITRDRLETGPAFDTLRDVIRASLHWYGSLRTLRLREDIAEKPVRALGAVSTLTQALEAYRGEIPKPVYKELERTAKQTAVAVEEADANVAKQLASLGGYATAGIAAIAYYHEIAHQVAEIEALALSLEEEGGPPNAERTAALKRRILDWAARVRQLRNLFAPYLGQENATEERRYRAKAVVDDVLVQLGSLLKKVNVDVVIPDDLRLPTATYIEWVSILQNVLLNSLNALQNSEHPRIRLFHEGDGKRSRLVIEDSGKGIDLARQADLFKAFARGIEIDPTLGELGYGGSGLGLTIVKMISERRDCTVAFRKPSTGYKSAFVLQWEEA